MPRARPKRQETKRYFLVKDLIEYLTRTPVRIQDGTYCYIGIQNDPHHDLLILTARLASSINPFDLFGWHIPKAYAKLSDGRSDPP